MTASSTELYQGAEYMLGGLSKGFPEVDLPVVDLPSRRLTKQT